MIRDDRHLVEVRRQVFFLTAVAVLLTAVATLVGVVIFNM